MDDQVLVAWIGAIGLIMVAVIGGLFQLSNVWLARRGTREHEKNGEVLQTIIGKIDAVDTRQKEHIDWHLHAEPNVVKIIRQDAEMAQ